MPLYDFTCDACDAQFDAFAKPGEAPPCTACGSERTRRLYSPISPPARMGLRGAAARQSDAVRADREHRKKEAFIAERRKKREGG